MKCYECKNRVCDETDGFFSCKYGLDRDPSTCGKFEPKDIIGDLTMNLKSVYKITVEEKYERRFIELIRDFVDKIELVEKILVGVESS